MKKFLLLLIGLVFPSTSMAITQVVSADQTLSNGDVMSIVTQQVYGTTKNFTVSGNQQIMSGGTSYNSNIYPYGQQNVEAGGISYNTNVQYRAVQNVNGTAYSSTVATSGTIDVNAGGYAEDTTVNGGIFIVSAGATVAKTYLNGGRENISGTDESSFVSGGLQEILSGGISKQAVVTGGTQQVDVGGSSIGATFSNNGRQKVYGTTEQTTVNSGAIIDIIDNGTAQQTTLNGGSMNVDYGATSYQTTVNSGTQSIYGTETGSSVNGGRQQVENGGFVSGAVVKTGGVQSIFSGGRAENTTLENGGWMFLFSGGTLSDTITANNSVVNIVGSNSIPDMEIQNSAINIPRDYAFSTVQFGNLSGSGIFSINSDLSEGTSDKILIDSGSGNFGLIVHDYSADGSTPLKYEIIDENAGASDRFYLVGNAVDVGAYRYNLEQEGSNWFLVRTQDVTDSALLAKNTYSSLASLFSEETRGYPSRLRDIEEEMKADREKELAEARANRQNIKSNYRGLILTLCANNSNEAIEKLSQILTLEGLSKQEAKTILLDNFDIIIETKKDEIGRRKISSIQEINLLNDDYIKDIFTLDYSQQHKSQGIIPLFYEDIKNNSLPIGDNIFSEEYKHTYHKGIDIDAQFAKKGTNIDILKKFKKDLPTPNDENIEDLKEETPKQEEIEKEINEEELMQKAQEKFDELKKNVQMQGDFEIKLEDIQESQNEQV